MNECMYVCMNVCMYERMNQLIKWTVQNGLMKDDGNGGISNSIVANHRPLHLFSCNSVYYIGTKKNYHARLISIYCTPCRSSR